MAAQPKLVPTVSQKTAPVPQKTDPKSFYIPVEEIKGFQEMVGGVPRATIFGLLGAPGSCKSTLAAHLCAEVAKADDGNILIFDTENKFHVFMHLAPVLSQRYGLNINIVRVRGNVSKSPGKDAKYEVDWEMEDDVDPKATNMFVIHCPEIGDITTMFGRGVDLKIFDSGKYKIIMRSGAWADTISEAPISEFFTKHKCKVLLIDSITNPTDEITAVGENFPARTDLTQAWMIQIHKVAANYNIPILATFHESLNETSPFSKDLKMEGGKGVTYQLAYIMYMLKENRLGLLPKGSLKPKRLAKNQRAMFISRHASMDVAPWKDVKYLTITPTGLHDGSPGNEDMPEDDENEA